MTPEIQPGDKVALVGTDYEGMVIKIEGDRAIVSLDWRSIKLWALKKIGEGREGRDEA